MDLRFSKEDEDFRAEFRSWLDANLPQEMRQPEFWRGKSDEESFQIRRDWEAGKADAGFCGIQWPTEYGGRGGTPTMKAIYDEEMAKANAPSTVNPLGLAFLAQRVEQEGRTLQDVGLVLQVRDLPGQRLVPVVQGRHLTGQPVQPLAEELALLQAYADLMGERFAGRVTLDVQVPAEARAEITVGRHAHPVAAAAEVLGHGADEAHPSARAAQVPGRTAGQRGGIVLGDEGQPLGREPLDQLRGGHRRPLAEGHALDEARHQPARS